MGYEMKIQESILAFLTSLRSVKRQMLVFCLIIVSVLGSSELHAQLSDTPAMPASSLLPEAGSTICDPEFGARIVRVTDRRDGASALVPDAGGSSFNLDSTRFVVDLDGTPTLYSFEPRELKFQKEGPLFADPPVRFESFLWSATERDTVLALANSNNNNASIYSFNTRTGTYTLLRDFSGILPEGRAHKLSKSPVDDGLFAFALHTSPAVSYVAAWNRNSDRAFAIDMGNPGSALPDFDLASVDRSGWSVIRTGAPERVGRNHSDSALEGSAPEAASSPRDEPGAAFDSLDDLSSILDTRQGVSAAITSTGRYVYLGLHPGRLETTGWARVHGVKAYRRTYAPASGRVGFVHYKGQELVQSASPNLQAGEWYYDSAATSLFLRLPDDSNPNSRSSSDAAPIVGEWRTAADSVIRVPKSAIGAAQVLDRNTASWVNSPKLTANVSRDGRFVIFGAGSSGGYKDVFIADLISPAATAQTLEWTNLVNCTATNNSLEKTGGQNQIDDASATSMQSIESGDGDVSFTASERDKERWCGLSNGNEIHQSSGDINFAIRLTGNKKAEVRENGSLRTKVKYKNGNTFRIAIQGGAVTYYKNDSLFYTSSKSPEYPLLVNASLVNTKATVSNVMINGGSKRIIVSISPATVTLQAGQSRQFIALVTAGITKSVYWTASGGTITPTGLYTAPNVAGVFTVNATSIGDSGASASAKVTVTGGADTTAPVISSIAASGLTTGGATINWTTNEPCDTQVEYGASTSYGSSSALASAMVTGHSATLGGLSAGRLYHYRVKSRDAAGNLATSADSTFTTPSPTDTTAPAISGVNASNVSSTGATISWTTNEGSDTQVEYGASTSYGASTPLASGLVTSHTVTLGALLPGRLYHYRVRSRDGAGNLATSNDFSFTTSVSSGPGPGLITDRNVYPEPAAPALPRAGGTYVDPVFRTTIMRVTDENDGTSCVNAYSYWPTFNLNSTRFFVSCNDVPKLYRFDPDAFQVLSKEPMFTAQAPGGGWPNTEDLTWSGLNPNVIFAHVGLRIYAYDVTTKTYNLVKDFTGELPAGHIWQLSRSLDDNVFAFTRRDPNYSNVGWVVWRRDQNSILVNTSMPGVDEVQIDKSGRYLNAKAGFGGGVDVRIIDLQTGSVQNLTDAGPDYSPGHSDSGTGTIVGHDNFNNGFTFRRMATPHQFQSIVSFGNDWTQGNHVSMLANDEAWALISNFSVGSVPAGVFHNEIFQAATNGSGGVRRIAHHRSVYYDYYDQPRANISRDGRFAAYTSNWGSRNRRDVFIVRLSATGSTTPPPPPPPGDTTAPVISGVAAAGVSSAGATINWNTNEASDTQVEYGTTTSYGSSTTLSITMGLTHSATVIGLAPSTLYHCRARSRDAAGNLSTSSDFIFTTAAGTGGPPAAGRQDVVWTNVVNCTASGNSLQKNAGRDDTADAGAVSQQSIASGDGYLEFKATQTDKLGFCGLARAPASIDFNAIDFAVKLTGRAVVEVRENNVYKAETGYSAGDLFRVSVEAGVVKYYRNGVLFYTSLKAPAYPLSAAASFISMDTTVTNAVMSTSPLAYWLQQRSVFIEGELKITLSRRVAQSVRLLEAWSRRGEAI